MMLGDDHLVASFVLGAAAGLGAPALVLCIYYFFGWLVSAAEGGLERDG